MIWSWAARPSWTSNNTLCLLQMQTLAICPGFRFMGNLTLKKFTACSRSVLEWMSKSGCDSSCHFGSSWLDPNPPFSIETGRSQIQTLLFLIGATTNSGAQLPQRHLYVVWVNRSRCRWRSKPIWGAFFCFRVGYPATLGWELNMGPIQLGSWDELLGIFHWKNVSFFGGFPWNWKLKKTDVFLNHVFLKKQLSVSCLEDLEYIDR